MDGFLSEVVENRNI